MATLYDDTRWSVEPADPSVGIFGDTWVHEACPKEYDEGCEITSTLSGRHVTSSGAVYADEHCTLTCLDCGVVTEFSDQTFIGFDGEEGI